MTVPSVVLKAPGFCGIGCPNGAPRWHRVQQAHPDPADQRRHPLELRHASAAPCGSHSPQPRLGHFDAAARPRLARVVDILSGHVRWWPIAHLPWTGKRNGLPRGRPRRQTPVCGSRSGRHPALRCAWFAPAGGWSRLWALARLPALLAESWASTGRCGRRRPASSSGAWPIPGRRSARRTAGRSAAACRRRMRDSSARSALPRGRLGEASRGGAPVRPGPADVHRPDQHLLRRRGARAAAVEGEAQRLPAATPARDAAIAAIVRRLAGLRRNATAQLEALRWTVASPPLRPTPAARPRCYFRRQPMVASSEFDAAAAVSLQTSVPPDRACCTRSSPATPYEVRLYCYSEQRAQKERGIVKRAAGRFEAALNLSSTTGCTQTSSRKDLPAASTAPLNTPAPPSTTSATSPPTAAPDPAPAGRLHGYPSRRLACAAARPTGTKTPCGAPTPPSPTSAGSLKSELGLRPIYHRTPRRAAPPVPHRRLAARAGHARARLRAAAASTPVGPALRRILARSTARRRHLSPARRTHAARERTATRSRSTTPSAWFCTR